MPQAPTPEDGEAGTSRHATHPTYPLPQCSISKTLPRKASYSPRTHTRRDTVRHTPAPPVSITRLTLLPRLSASGFTSRCSRRARRPVRAPDRARAPAHREGTGGCTARVPKGGDELEASQSGRPRFQLSSHGRRGNSVCERR